MIHKYAVAGIATLLCAIGAAPAPAADTADAANAANAANATGQHFIKEAIQGNLAEVKVGQLAQEKGKSQGVKDFGATLAKDHETVNQSATQAAQQMNVTPPNTPAPKQKMMYKQLASLSGEQFDREFIDSMVKDHKEDIAQYQREAKHTGPAADYAKQTLPKLREHLKMAEDLEYGGEHSAGNSRSTEMKE